MDFVIWQIIRQEYEKERVISCRLDIFNNV